MAHDKIKAIQQAIMNGNDEYEGIKLPLPQRSGTYTQQSAYANHKAQQLYEQHFKAKKQLIQINLQQCIVMSESGLSVLASCRKHDNKFVYNKPLLRDDSEIEEVVDLMVSKGFLTRDSVIEYIQTDSFSVGYWNGRKSETTII